MMLYPLLLFLWRNNKNTNAFRLKKKWLIWSFVSMWEGFQRVENGFV